jgi:hypothetical protein
MAAPIIIAGEARTRWAPAPRPTSDDYLSRWVGQAQARANNLGKGATYWWVIAAPGEAATQGAILVAESAFGDTKVIPVPPLWAGRYASRVPVVEATGLALAA